MRVLVTGSSGLLGSALVPLLTQDGNQVYDITSKECNLLHKEQVLTIFAYLQPTHVVHLAARVGGLFDNLENNMQFFEQNVAINTNVLSTCKNLQSVKKVISCMSTCIFPSDAPLPLTTANLHNGLPHFRYLHRQPRQTHG